MIKKQTILLFLFASVALVILSFFIRGAYNQKAQTISFLNQETVVQDAQLKLKELGFYSGEINNLFDSNTRQAVLAFQEANNLPMNSRLDLSTQKALLGIDPYGEGRPSSVYNISVSKDNPGTFKFNYKFDTSRLSSNKDEAHFDIPIALFNEEMAKKELGEEGRFIDFGYVRDVWGYPVKENAYHSLKNVKAKEISQNKKSEGDVKNLDPGNSPGVYNCRANTSITGYFKAYFEDVALGTGVGYDDPTFGGGRRAEACQVLQDISELIMLDQTSVTPDILFMANSPVPPGALAAATAFFGYYQTNPDNGSLHKHIISQQDPTPNPGYFDALILTGFNGISWDVDSTLNPLTYDFYTVLYHEVMHALGFRSLLPATISQTNVSHQHGTFDYYSHEDSSLLNSFIDQVDGLLQVPVGAPSPWFITNEVVYQGIKNILGANPDDVVPVYSPSSWEQGSSLSHFDMARSPGDIFVMHPSIGTNTTRSIHEDEKDVLCHMGYRVSGLAGCEEATPFAMDDVANLDLVAICINPLNNDTSFTGGSLSISSLDQVNIQPGDSIVYYSGVNCSGQVLTSAFGSKSFNFTPASTLYPRIMEYEVVDSVSNRISNRARISLVSCNNTNPDEYVCNGDFETQPLYQLSNYPYPTNVAFFCPQGFMSGSVVPFWCGNGSSDLTEYDNTLATSWMLTPFNCSALWFFFNGCVVNTPDFTGRSAVGLSTTGVDGIQSESIINKLKDSLVPGEQYKLSFDVLAIAEDGALNDLSLLNSVYVYSDLDTGSSFNVNSLSPNNLLVASSTPFEQVLPNQTVPFNSGTSWTYVEHVFTADAPHEFLRIYGAFSGTGHQFLWFYFDNVSIEKISLVGNNDIEGVIYDDQNSNGSQDQVEPGLPGVEVGLYQLGNSLPIQTTMTQNIPNLGGYEFLNIPDGTYYVGLVNENIYQSITDPVPNPGLVPGHNYVREIIASGGQTYSGNNFGVGLNTQPLPQLNLRIQKTLWDSTLSIFDRNITWRVEVVNNGPNDATNIFIGDNVPQGLIYNYYSSPDPDVYFDSNTEQIVIPQLQSGNSVYIDITMKVPNNYSVCGTKINIAELSSLDQTDIFTIDNQSSAQIKLRPCRLNSSNIKK